MDRRFAGSSAASLLGRREPRRLANPAAGADWSLKLPSGYAYRLLLVRWTLKASAQAAGRMLAFQISDGDGLVALQTVDSGEVTAGLTASISLAPDLTTAASSDKLRHTIAMPAVLLDAGWTIGSLTTAIQTEDQVENVRLLLEQLDDTYPGETPGREEVHIVHHDRELAHAGGGH